MAFVRRPIVKNAAMGRLVEQLRTLPGSWSIVSDVEWTEANGDGPMNVRHADFVVLVPHKGMCVIQFVDAAEIRVTEQGKWRRKVGDRWNHWKGPNPFAQGMGAVHQLSKILPDKSVLGKIPFSFLVVMPRGDVTAGQWSTFDPSIWVSAQDMGALKERILGAIQRSAYNARRIERFDAEMCRLIARGLKQKANVVRHSDEQPSAQEQIRQIESLTRQQYFALQGFFYGGRVGITGPAGSGKTILALTRLRQLFLDGKRVVLVCYHPSLRDYLKLTNPDLADLIVSIDAFFLDFISQHGGPSIDAEPTSQSQWSQDHLPGLVMDATFDLSDDDRWDAIIVDEGQDLGPHRLMALEDMLHPGGEMLICFDEGQDIYEMTKAQGGTIETVFTLRHNCRNTQQINALANRVRDQHIESMDGLPNGDDCLVEIHSLGSDRALRALELARQWAKDGRRVAILSPHEFADACDGLLAQYAEDILCQTIASWMEGQVLFSTIEAFKGLEADHTVVVDVLKPGDDAEQKELYVACTRGRLSLAVLCCSSDVAQTLDASKRTA